MDTLYLHYFSLFIFVFSFIKPFRDSQECACDSHLLNPLVEQSLFSGMMIYWPWNPASKILPFIVFKHRVLIKYVIISFIKLIQQVQWNTNNKNKLISTTSACDLHLRIWSTCAILMKKCVIYTWRIITKRHKKIKIHMTGNHLRPGNIKIYDRFTIWCDLIYVA